jgi:hypothetical protein
MSDKRMPRCLGAFEEDDPQCDGNPVGKTEGARAPCVYRDRCAGFVKLMDITKRPRDYFVRTLDTVPHAGAKPVTYTFANHDGFEEQVNEQILLFGIQSGRARYDKPLKPKIVPKKTPKVVGLRAPGGKVSKPSKVFARAGAKARSKQTRDGREKSKEVGQWYIKRVSTRLGRKVAAFEESARPGELFLVDRLESSNYCALYCKGKTRRIAITSYLYKPNKGLIEVRLAVPFQHYMTVCSRSERDELAPVDHTGKDGAFKVRIMEVDSHRASMIAETLAKVEKNEERGRSAGLSVVGFEFPERRT